MQNNKIYSSNHLKIFDKIITKKRLEIVDIINNQIILYNINEVLDIGTTNDTKNKSSNFIVKNLKNIKNFNSISDQLITSSFFKKKLQKSITEDFSEYEIENFGKSFDQLTKETVKAFLVDSKKSDFKI